MLTAGLQFVGEFAVAEHRPPIARKPQTHRDDDVAPRFMLEHRIAVAKVALIGAQREVLARAQVHRVELVKAILQLQTIRADVLHGCRAHGPRNEGHVF